MSELGVLRDIDESELELILSWRNTPSIRQNMYNNHIISIEEHKRWWSTIKNRSDCRYFIYEFNGQPSGIVGMVSIDQKNRNCTWTFNASPEAPKGTGSRMEYLALNYMFDELGLHKVYCEVLAFNTPVIKMHKKYGFEEEGIFKEQYFRDDEFIDVYRLGLFSRTWLSLRDNIRDKLIKISTR